MKKHSVSVTRKVNTAFKGFINENASKMLDGSVLIECYLTPEQLAYWIEEEKKLFKASFNMGVIQSETDLEAEEFYNILFL